jgi:hypothetical protein
VALPVGTQGQEPASPINGMVRYSTTANDIEAYIVGAWTTLTTGGGSASIYLGSARGATDPSVNGDATTGFYTAGSHLVDVSANNTQIVEWSTSGENIVNGSLLMNGANGLSYPTTETNTTDGSIAIGSQALANMPAMPVGTTSAYTYGNTAVGYQTLSAAGMTTAAIQNTAMGYLALQKDTSGNGNTAVGWQAGLNLTSGSNNTILGRGAVQSATTAGSETGIGFKALSGVTGNNNTALGAFALVGSTSGGNNTAIGAQAMYNNSTAAPGSDNTALGYEALYNIQSTASQNTALGDQAGKTITTGSSNTIIGYNVASTTLNTGSNNILIGTLSSVDTPTATTSSYLSIGNAITANMTNTNAVQGSNTALVGIAMGTALPLNALDVNGAVVVGTSYAGVSTAPTNGLIVQGKVGIGTTAPYGLVNAWGVPGATANYGLLSIGTSWTGAGSSFGGNSSGTLLAGNAPSGYGGNLLDLQVGGVSEFSIAASGNVVDQGRIMIGTSSYGAWLDVARGGAGAVFGSAGTNGAGQIQFRNANGANNGTLGYISSTEANQMTLQASGGSGFLTFYTGGSEHMRITTAGNVGIGSTSPVVSLDLSQKTDALALPVGTQGQEPASPMNGMIRYSTTANDIEAYIAGACTTLTTGGSSASITLGTSAATPDPASSYSATTGLFSPASGVTAITAAGTEEMRVNATGVGIGTTTIANKLDVNGGVAIGTYAGIAGSSNGIISSGNVGIGTNAPA